MSIPEAFLLLTIPNATVTLAGYSQTGVLFLECVTVQLPDTSSSTDRDVFLVVRSGSIEAPVDPTQIIRKTEGQGHRTFSFHLTDSDSDPPVLVISVFCGPESGPNSLEDLGTFETILAQYAAEFRSAPSGADVKAPIKPPSKGFVGYDASHGDLRGHLLVVNQDDGEIVAQFDRDTYKLQEDPQIHERGHENDAIIIEVPDDRPGYEQDATALQMFVRAIPPEEQDWVTKSATIVSHAISATTNLLLTTISTASNYYISHSAPSPHHSAATYRNGIAPGPPPRALVFLTSEKTRKGLASVHDVSSQAVQVSSKTVSAIDGMIRRAMGSRPKHQRLLDQAAPVASASRLSPVPMSMPIPTVSGSGVGAGVMPPKLPPRAPSPSYNHLSPPPYTTYPSLPNDGKPPLPLRRSPSPANAPPLPPRTLQGFPDRGAPLVLPQPRVPLSRKERILLSADLILSTLDHETRRVLDAGTATVGSVMSHKYGAEAAESSVLMAGTARNVGLVYVDMRGIGRRALLKRAGRQFVKGRLSNNKYK
ncbi:hypothetical protein H0H92_012021 [Tricholoma furcatifolium]|nr:hypothetical protein H0H92_012021 [Tricholoma furcatifolium]